MFYDSNELIDLDIELNKVNQLFKIQSLGIDIDFLINQETNIETLKFLYENGKGLDQDKFELLYRAKNSNLDDISFILDERYTAAQIKEILAVYENGKNYKLLLNPEYSKNKMKAYKHLLLADLLNEKTKNLNAQEAKQYIDFRKTIEDKSDIIKELFDNGYKPGAIQYLSFLESVDKECFNILVELVKDKIFGQEQLKAITAIIKNDEHIKDKNYDFYLDEKICASQIKKYHLLESLGYDVTKINKEITDIKQLNVYILMYKTGFDIDSVINKGFSAWQLDSILSGVRAKCDVSCLLNKDLQPQQIKLIVDNLKYNKENPGKEIDINYLLNPTLSLNELTHIARVLKKGTLEEKIEIYKKYNPNKKEKDTIEISR